ncbi:Shedu anti-phage system protein SduA domain-containing protein [Actinopolymorpha sp. NPDC004070]|uniref:Shedu anti-phage system protein SduA domain-containing protein n=1 Tax=Actinopolymorpha sp. NPDC004070 TaxID=3154548 RepID=UPI0033B91D35
MLDEPWRTAVSSLQALISGPSQQQLDLAGKLGIPMGMNTPEPVARVRLARAVREPLKLNRPPQPSENSITWLRELEAALDVVPVELDELQDQADVSAWIQVRYAARTIRHLETLQPGIGDILSVESPSKAFQGEVSSIGSDGQIYFRGGIGRRAWPHQVSVLARVGDADYRSMQYIVAQQVTMLRQEIDTGYARLPELAEFRVDETPNPASLAALEEAVHSAVDEKPIQKVLEDHPELLAHLILGNHASFVIPQKKLGAEHVPDFLVAGVTSAGFKWLLVELESPTAPLTVKDGQGEKRLRKGIHQITTWRDWLTENLNYAKKPKKEQGLGLPGIRANSDGLVIISREDGTPRGNFVRNLARESDRIEIRTYDWLIRAARDRMHGVSKYDGDALNSRGSVLSFEDLAETL